MLEYYFCPKNLILGIKAQGQPVPDTVVYQDNMSSIQLETNGVKSSSARTRHIQIRYYFVADLQHRKELRVVYEPTDTMWDDYFTKPLQGKKFLLMRKKIMNEVDDLDECMANEPTIDKS